MLTSNANQYLRPEYLTPLPTTLDAKKSPLALLAQTCSQIGADTSSSKPIIPPLEKKKTEPARDKISPGSSSGPDRIKSHEKKDEAGGGGSTSVRATNSPEESKVRTPVSKSSSPSVVSSPSPTTRVKTPAPDPKPDPPSTSTTVTSSSTSTSTSSKLGFSTVLSTSEHSALKDLPLGTFKPGLPGPLGYPSCLSGHLPVDSGLPSGLLGQLKPGLSPSLAGLNPYLSYARLKTPSGGEALVPVCRDPYCTGCQLNVPGAVAAHMLKPGGCPSGCVQCDHQKNGFLASLMPGMPPGAAAAALAYAPQHSFLGGSLPFVCNWIQGDAYCGKRFGSSEELLQHLRSHTNLAAASDSTPLALLNPGGLPPHPLLHRTYPTPPLSPLSAAARYHPYGKPAGIPGLPPTSLAGSMGLTPHPAMAPYYSPYSLYGQRLGGSGLHP